MIKEERVVNLQEVLDFREEKDQLQKALMEKYEQAVVVSFGMNIPGKVKVTKESYWAFIYGCKTIESLFHDLGLVVYRKKAQCCGAGNSAIYALGGSSIREMKEKMVEIEENHPLGRLFDIDVMEKGSSISRVEIGREPRKCLLCGQDAKLCCRSVAHSQEEVAGKAGEIIRQYLN
ncbi:citrate lyase holo-[acyl-carrier protein] synthase [Ohessyouella blattaphilus]|uniref:citrate lyase holo-[acyl-carrier protein] synthase n=1 Tax=Ohessyouella blattaphilus TaxID=2949333 RepID=A0ABT1EHL2_9FIRM|nr:citrate lyase holo-[acyl-carrier protein] synthase [Ohessyouella blattaphilus]MCP1110197.1 citrate lyase holo-[acyl-carrier protein] synthase [Ohessyouella blattaphilus]MCR8563591.1 citrate lyase holo-[acyl-carrier protein] synthase [Ohessyouella blattaphilus]